MSCPNTHKFISYIALVSLGLTLGALFIIAATGEAEGQQLYAIVLPEQAAVAEKTAASELAKYLAAATGSTTWITTEKQSVNCRNAIYLGATKFCDKHGIRISELAPEEWLIKSLQNDLVIGGGSPRGTLYGVYHFLEDIIGIHWWNPWEESVPEKSTLTLKNIDMQGRPRFGYRDIYMLYGNDGGRFAARNRLNRQGDAAISREYGGGMDYGPPYHVHTFYKYIPPDKYFNMHPEWFSLISGKRTFDRAQLCLTNVHLREVFLSKLKEFIELSRSGSENAMSPCPVVFNISQTDGGRFCQCESCLVIAKREESEAGVLLDFVNYMADGIKKKFPMVYIETLAYLATEKPPKTIRPRSNVIVRLCNTSSSYTRNIFHDDNGIFREALIGWAKMTKNIRIWNYAVTFDPDHGLPLPSMRIYPVDYQFYAANNVEGVFTEHEYPILADMRDLKVWVMMKMLEDPYANYQSLIQTFTNGFYGSAGKVVRDYLTLLETAADSKPSYINWIPSPPMYRYLTLDFVAKAQKTFDLAERQVCDEPTYLRRLRHARLPLDRATLLLYPKLIREWIGGGRDLNELPLNRQTVAKRCLETWQQQAEQRLEKNASTAAEKERASEYVTQIASRNLIVNLPRRFSQSVANSVYDFTAFETRNYGGIVKVVLDEEAESGVANRLAISDADLGRNRLPMQWGLYDRINKKSLPGRGIAAKDVPGPGYHWYKMGTFKMNPSFYMYLFWNWILQVDVGSALDSNESEHDFEIWASLKFDGPDFPYGSVTDKNSISVERVIVIRGQF